MNQNIDKLLSQKWLHLNSEFKEIINGHHPGVYLLAFSSKKLLAEKIKLGDIFYVGMSNSKGGVKSRLKQFICAIEKGYGHSAGNRFQKEYCSNKPHSSLKNKTNFFYVSLSFACDVNKKTRTSEDLKTMGNIAQLEYYILSYIKDKIGIEPKLNKK